ncbi:pyrimidine 5'-nucleotidase [Roseinatronobacter alkalisoli]|uniref:Pyrimidine 5'-nucleotidase n=1 Tax=Roseinatronobacter alkalisoli TaxID=3028235 RepID=A0ABT5T610_9RHOB|nr:pyrimidine 5'-nucleotidase [Roseinatronobacter sp. HJB301]MDD7970414.1 pyrimidine 5'-nucleotidase [Roseinatronobacter sp. HJB301]
MVADSFSHVRGWVFDLDNTLYPPEIRLFDQIEQRMTDFVMRELKVDHAIANKLRHDYWATYGTTLAGLMRCHDIDPVPYLKAVHDIDFSVIPPDHDLRDRIADLPGRRIVYTNGSRDYALQVLNARGMAGIFDAVYGVEHAGYRPKPEHAAFAQVFEQDGLDSRHAAMFEDDPRNLAAPFEMGMRTVHVAPARHDAPFIHHHTDDLTGFLALLAR